VGQPLSAQPTLRDVARRSGVSVTTASVVLNDRRDGVRVTDATRERVRQAARELGYTPNVLARSLRTQTSRTLGLLSDEVVTTPYAVAMLAAALREAARHGYLLSIVEMDSAGSASVGRRALDLLLQQQVTSVIYATMYHRVIDAPDPLPASTVFLNCRPAGGGYRAVVPDERQGARLAVTELLRSGHRRVAFLDDEQQPVASQQRLAGLREGLAAAGLRFDPALHVRGHSSAQGGLAVGALLDLPPAQRPTGVFCFNDRMAMGAFRAARTRGLRVPDDLSVVGFDDQQFIASELDPPLTTVRIPHPEMGTLAVRRLLDDTDPVDAECALVACELVRRHSVAPPSQHP
jgi:LacI family transcriptional regulator